MCAQLVAARGCAYVVMSQRSDASKAVDDLKNVRIGGGNYAKVKHCVCVCVQSSSWSPLFAGDGDHPIVSAILCGCG